MKKVIIKSEFSLFKFEELDDVLKTLVSKAIDATDNSYSPYSNFKVGAALQLEDGTIVIGANQENAAFSVTMCAERSAIFNAQSNHPNLAITTIAIAAKNVNGLVHTPISPCGSCRQVILEMEQRYKRNIKILLCGSEGIYVINSIKDLLPLSFVDESMR
ncbi:cytidine deaminase [uncultured Prevotella sp.]|uniref:cytidine deaminase n=1 Tax=uncultured Prevotella sp. TaxID=159272 RepID=UPI0025D7B6D6|nr:cytidine deaminase [uncultured Prevotella sp.]